MVAEGDVVIVHGRFAGLGLPVNGIAADGLRIEHGRLVEHWDVIQDKATRASSKSGLPMFGDTCRAGALTATSVESVAMTAIQVEAFGNPAEVLTAVDIPDVGAPAAGDVVIALAASPIKQYDLLHSTDDKKERR